MRRCSDCPGEARPKSVRCAACFKARRMALDTARQRKLRDSPEYREKYRAYTLKKKYGMTVKEYDAMFEAQGMRCAICRSDDPRWKKGWHVDHCHESGVVRGILCQKCNLMIGMAADNMATLARAIEYLGGVEFPSPTAAIIEGSSV